MTEKKTPDAHNRIFTFQCHSSNGKIVRKEESGPLGKSLFEYSYDAKGHLTEVRRNNIVVEKYAYDNEGRRVEDYRAWSGGSRHFIYGFDGALIRVNDAYLEWTPQGRLQAIYSNAERVEYEYGDDTRLDQVYLHSGVTVQYAYDGSGLMPVRISEDREPVWQFTWKNRIRLMRCVDIRAGVTYDFSYGDARIPQSVTMQAQAHAMYRLTGLHASSLKLRLWADQIGSVRVLSTSEGRVLKHMEYDSFGNLTHENRADWHFPLGFACGLSDAYTGFVRFGYRDYDPQVGRFTAKDPIGHTGGDNDLWDYCVDDPVSKIDSIGLQPQKVNLGPYKGDELGIYNNHPIIFQHTSKTHHKNKQALSGAFIENKGILGTIATGADLHGSTRLIIYGDPETNTPSSWTLLEWRESGKKNEMGWPLYTWIRVPTEKEASNKPTFFESLKEFKMKR